MWCQFNHAKEKVDRAQATLSSFSRHQCAENAFLWIPRLKVAMENGVRLRSGTSGEPMLRTSRGSRDALPVRAASKAKDP